MAKLTPYLCVADARAAIDFDARAFDAVVSYKPIVMPDGRVGHAEISIDGARLMLSDPFAEVGVEAADEARGAAVTLHLQTDDVDALAQKAVAAGARLDRGPEDAGVGRVAVLRDPFGHRWFLNDESPT